jgi:cytochrome c-type biogenesis protein CcmH
MLRLDHIDTVLRRFAQVLFVASSLVALPAQAGEAAPAAEDPVLEKRVTQLSELLRCLVCQNQTIADSHAELAIDLKNQIREKMKAGESDKQIVDYMVARYGDFVLYKPPVKATTVILWVGPFVLLLGGLGFVFVKVRQRLRLAQAGEALTDEEHRRASALLQDEQIEKGATR